MNYAKSGQQNLPAFEFNPKINDPALYEPSDELVDAVNVALAIGQPLLLTGEPGTGKTQLAFHLAHFFQLGKPLMFNAQTTSVANDLFYRYDALGHFQYNRNDANPPLTPDQVEARFVKYEALGEAIRQRKRAVVLIDEIDKAPRDLPNDLLGAIEKLRFDVPEINDSPKRTYESSHEHRPIIIITSNSEKNLPDAFLRRVTYFHIGFPKPAALVKILNKKFDGISMESLELAVGFFDKVRENKAAPLRKKPATAELIYWVWFLQKQGFDFKSFDTKNPILKKSLSILAKNQDDLNTLLTKY